MFPRITAWTTYLGSLDLLTLPPRTRVRPNTLAFFGHLMGGRVSLSIEFYQYFMKSFSDYGYTCVA